MELPVEENVIDAPGDAIVQGAQPVVAAKRFLSGVDSGRREPDIGVIGRVPAETMSFFRGGKGVDQAGCGAESGDPAALGRNIEIAGDDYRCVGGKLLNFFGQPGQF